MLFTKFVKTHFAEFLLDVVARSVMFMTRNEVIQKARPNLLIIGAAFLPKIFTAVKAIAKNWYIKNPCHRWYSTPGLYKMVIAMMNWPVMIVTDALTTHQPIVLK